MARFLANENISPLSIALLRGAGHDIAAVAEIAASIDDPAVLDLARRGNRILLTYDRDYGDLVFHRAHPAPIGIVYFRFTNDSPEKVSEWVIAWLAAPNPFPLEGWFTSVRDSRVRRRPLP